VAAHTADEKKLRKLLRELRKEQKLTQVDLAKKIRETQQLVSKVESGDRRLYATQLFEYVNKGFGLTLEDFARRYEARR